MKQFDTLALSARGPALILTIDQPKSLNALAQEVVNDLEAFVDWFETTGFEYRGVIITGAGEKSFVAGANIVQMNAMDAQGALAYGRQMHAVTERLEALQVPVIAAVNGFALGGGCELALACDFIYASEKASFGQPEVTLGLVPGFGGSVRLPRRVGNALARELIFTGRRIKAEEALRIGLANRVVPAEELIDQAVATIEEIAAVAPTAVANAKSALVAMDALNTHDALVVEGESFQRAFATNDSVEGRSAFVEKRSPNFPGN
ncbi:MULTISPECIES: enoyl-CoA hydratase-related protein [Micrococcaceae]|uniref:enoyl-CoA hydratase/isomerase family protein n=1 Tax=Micrococcaceae TaxID=1268 RepID=UPI001036650E|nr:MULTISPECIES: enoyl-CoA hydratase-related protein [Micrococcaceae]TAP28779.1 enoyl-CoA hydratase [Arthrobacter sp. S41]UXN32381.1 enoyl-CoA hydratase-related protein [Glutamicibacter sp. M10]